MLLGAPLDSASGFRRDSPMPANARMMTRAITGWTSRTASARLKVAGSGHEPIGPKGPRELEIATSARLPVRAVDTKAGATVIGFERENDADDVRKALCREMAESPSPRHLTSATWWPWAWSASYSPWRESATFARLSDLER